MAKASIIWIQTIFGCIHYNNGIHVAGGPAFECDAEEAKRLIALGVAAPADAPASTPVVSTSVSAIPDHSELLTAIAGAQTMEDLLAMMPQDEPAAEIVEAFETRMRELEEPRH